MVLDATRRAPLLAAKLGALVRATWPSIPTSPVPFQAGAGVVASQPADLGSTSSTSSTTTVAWLLLDETRVEADPLAGDPVDGPPRSRLPRGWLGGSFLWALRQGASELHILSEHVNGDDARRAALLAAGGPKVTLWRVTGRTLEVVEGAPVPAPIEPPAAQRAFMATLTAAGVDVVIEHGVVCGEVLGLEVARVVIAGGQAELHVGVGRHDRLAHQIMHPGPEGVAASLVDAVATVRAYRRGDAPMHPANRLAPERWLRAVVVGDPSIVGINVALRAAEPTTPSRLKWASPAIAVGEGVVVACTVGLDLDAVSDAADARASLSADARLVLVVTEDNRALRTLAAQLRPPAEVVVVRGDWRSVVIGGPW